MLAFKLFIHVLTILMLSNIQITYLIAGELECNSKETELKNNVSHPIKIYQTITPLNFTSIEEIEDYLLADKHKKYKALWQPFGFDHDHWTKSTLSLDRLIKRHGRSLYSNIPYNYNSIPVSIAQQSQKIAIEFRLQPMPLQLIESPTILMQTSGCFDIKIDMHGYIRKCICTAITISINNKYDDDRLHIPLMYEYAYLTQCDILYEKLLEEYTYRTVNPIFCPAALTKAYNEYKDAQEFCIIMYPVFHNILNLEKIIQYNEFCSSLAFSPINSENLSYKTILARLYEIRRLHDQKKHHSLKRKRIKEEETQNDVIQVLWKQNGTIIRGKEVDYNFFK